MATLSLDYLFRPLSDSLGIHRESGAQLRPTEDCTLKRDNAFCDDESPTRHHYEAPVITWGNAVTVDPFLFHQLMCYSELRGMLSSEGDRDADREGGQEVVLRIR